MYKRLSRVALGLIGLMGMGSIGVVNAATVTHYTGSNISYVLNSGFDTQKTFTGVGTITIISGTDIITILDRNLGATAAGTGCEDPNWKGLCKGGDSTYGYHFQWGNNYGFTGVGSLPATHVDDSLVISGDVGVNYTNSVFHYGNENWINDDDKINMWGGSETDTDTLDGTGWQVSNPTERRGPCPENFHVPSRGELNKLKIMMGNDVSATHNSLKIPFAGTRSSYYYSSVVNLGSYAYIWSSSPYLASSPRSRELYLEMDGDIINIGMESSGRADTSSVRCFYDEYEPYSQKKTITYNPNGGTFSGKAVDEIQKVIFTKDGSGKYIPDINLQFPNKAPQGETGYMFDGWYISATQQTPANEWTGYVSDDTTVTEVFAKWLEFKDLDLEFGGTRFTIMDRNLGAEAPAKGIYNNGTPESLDKLGKYYQWGNNYGFDNSTSPWLYTGGNLVVNTTSTPWGPGNYYSSATFITTISNRWDDAGNGNLWGGTGTTGDKQGPCPEGYHVPSNTEWQGILDSFTEWKDNIPEGTTFCNNYGGVNFTCFAAKLQLPFAGNRSPWDSKFNSQGSYGGYWSSSCNYSYKRRDTSYGLGFDESYISTQYKVCRGAGYSIRCFKNEPNPKKLKLSFISDDVEVGSGMVVENMTGSVPAQASTITKTGYTFYRYLSGTTSEFAFENTPILPNMADGNDIVYFIAHWSPITYTIAFDGNATDTAGTQSSINAEYDTGYITPESSFTREGYTFASRNSQADGNGTIYNVGSELKNLTTTGGDTITLYAQWTKNAAPSGGSYSGGGGSRRSSTATTDDNKDSTKNSDTTKPIDTDSQEIISQDDGTKPESQVFSEESQEAYAFAYKKGITTMPTIQKADMNGRLTRIAMAKMLSNYAINILGKKPANKVVPKFKDINEKLNEDYGGAVDLAYQLGIMGINMKNDMFRPYDEVTRGEFGTALSRMLYNIADGNDVYYSTHLKKLMEEKIITNNNPDMKELRGYVMIMLKRSAGNQ